VQIKYNSETTVNMLAMQPVCYYSSNVHETHRLTEILQTYSVNVTRAGETILKGVLLLLMQKCCNYQVLLTTKMSVH